MDFLQSNGEEAMRYQSYFNPDLEGNTNKKTESVPLKINCTGVVSHTDFSNFGKRQDFYCIYLIKGKMHLGDSTLLPGDIIIYEPGHYYEYQNEGDTEYLWVHYTGFEAKTLTRTAVHHTNKKQHIGIRKEIIDCFKNLFRQFILRDEFSEAISICLLRELLYRTGRFAERKEESKISYQTMEYIHGHFSEKLDVDMLAQMENMSSTTFREAFRKQTGLSPNEYIISQRISSACLLLTQTNMSVNDIAADVGYSDQYYFSRLFKKKTSLSPLKYRNANI